jgi:hypothetical protein
VNIRWRITAEVDGKNLFRNAFIERSFDDLLLVDEKGNVLFQTGEVGLQFTRADLLLTGDIRASDLGNEVPKSSPAGQSMGKGANGLEFQIQVKRKDDTTFLKKVPTRQEVSVGGKSLYVFALPLNLPIIDKEQEALEGDIEKTRSFILLGLVSKDKFRNETWQLSPSVVLLLILVALLTLLALPLLKLFSMGPQDQWSLKDLILVAGAGIVGTGLLTLALVDGGHFLWAKEQVDNELEQFAGPMAQHTGKELDDAINQLYEFDKHRANELKVSNQGSKASETNPPTEKKTCRDKKEEINRPSAMLNVLQMKFVPHGALPSYRDFASVFWVDCGGRLVEVWDARTKNDYYHPIVTSLSDRSYFINVIDRRYWRFKNIDTPFTLEPLFSRIDGTNTVVVAIKSKSSPSANPEDIVVAGLESRFISLFEPIVPPGIGFAVVDDSNGKVLFHSQGQRNLREKFFDEIDHDMRLKALIASRAQGCEFGIYGGNRHRFCVRAFEDIPWALVVFKNMEPLRTANLEAVTVGSILYLLYVFAVLSVVLAGFIVYKMHPVEEVHRQYFLVWIWPSQDLHAEYVASALVTLGLLLVGMLSLLWLPAQYAFVVGVIVLPIIGAFITYTLLNRKSLSTSFAKLGSIVNYRQAYIVMCGTMLALCSVLPAAVCMTLSYESEQILLLKAGALELAKSFAKRADQVRERYQYHEDNTLITERLYGEQPKVSANMTSWCQQRLDNVGRRDVHLRPDEQQPGGDRNSWWPRDHIVCHVDELDKDELIDNSIDWFEETYQYFRVPYNDEFTRTHGLFSGTQKSEDVQWYVPSDGMKSKDVPWYVSSDGMKVVSYRPVHALKDLSTVDRSKAPERWNVAVAFRSWQIRLLGVLLLGFPFMACIFAWPMRQLSLSLSARLLLLLVGGIAAVPVILQWPGETLLAISVLLLPLFFWWLAYTLPGFVARRVLLLDVTALEANLSFYANELRKALASPPNREFTKHENLAFEKEFGVSEQLCRIGKTILSDTGKREDFVWAVQSVGFEPSPVATFACDEARAYYQDIWMAMSNEEKMALLHLARNGFILQDHPGLLSLFKKGWILCSPQLRYVNESFRQFVLSREEEVTMLQDQLAGGIWDHLRGPLGLGMVFILVGLMYTQQEFLTGITALVGVLVGLVPVISKVFDLFKGQKGSSSES